MSQPGTDATSAALTGGPGGSGGDGRLAPDSPGGIRGQAARGTIINAAFLVALTSLGLLKGFAVAAFLSVTDYGIWGILAVSLSTLILLAQVGVDDKFIQQDDPDQERAFQQAFTMQLLLCGAFVALIVIAMPFYSWAYGNWDLLLPGWAVALAMPALAFQAPMWAFARRMDFFKQRLLQSFDPVVGLVVTVGSAAAGLGYWSLVVGLIAGSWAAALASIRSSPYPFRFRFDRGTVREYVRFSGPLFLGALSTILVAQIPILIAEHSIGTAGIGAIAIAANISAYASRVDEIVTDTIYPAVCTVKDRMELLEETFIKTNRLALLWAMPLGVGVVLFAPDLITYVIGERWEPAVFVIQAFALTAAINQIAFNWSAFMRALGRTRPIAVASYSLLAGTAVFTIPLLLAGGLKGYAVGAGLAILVMLVVRLGYVSRLFPIARVLKNVARGFAPTLPGLAAVLLVRYASSGPRGAAQALVELGTFVAITAATTLWAERALFAEFLGYLKSRRAPSEAPAV